MTIASDLLVILAFLSTLYILLGLLCAIAERVQSIVARPLTQGRGAWFAASRVRRRRGRGSETSPRRHRQAPHVVRQGVV